MKILFIKDGLEMGGTTASFISLISEISKNEKIDVYVWINRLTSEKRDILPYTINIYESPSLSEAFLRPKGFFRKIVSYIKNQQFFLWLVMHFYRLLRLNAKYQNRIFQKYELLQALAQNTIDLTDFSIVIAWEELFPSYLLSSRIICNKKISWFHPDYHDCGFDWRTDSTFFQKFDAIIAVSISSSKSLMNNFPLIKKRIFFIENLIDVDQIRNKSKDSIIERDYFSDNPSFVTVCRIQNISKAIDRAIKVSSKLKKEGFKFRWYFVGDGEDKILMEKFAKSLGVEDMVIFLGKKNNPYPYMRMADLFILQSYYEGKPISVDEALIIGTPVLVSDYSSAKNQVGKGYGIIAENSEYAIYNSIKSILLDLKQLEVFKANLLKFDVSSYNNPNSFFKVLKEVDENDFQNI